MKAGSSTAPFAARLRKLTSGVVSHRGFFRCLDCSSLSPRHGVAKWAEKQVVVDAAAAVLSITSHSNDGETVICGRNGIGW